MPEIESCPVAGNASSPAQPRKPTPAVWLASGFVWLTSAWSLLVGVILCTSGWILAHELLRPETVQRDEAMAREYGPQVLVPHLINRVLEGLLNIGLSGLIAWCQFAAVFRRSAARSFIVAAFFLLSGLLGCAAHPFNLTWGVMDGAFLFSGIVMFRWGWRLMKRRPEKSNSVEQRGLLSGPAK
jgi:hypothetical protein